jgi:hypothetical protein
MIKLRRIRWMSHVGCMENKRNAYRCFVGTAEGKGLHGISRFRIDINVKIDSKEPGWRVWTEFI